MTVSGIIPVLPTPIGEDEQLDFSGLERLLDFLSAHPIGGLWVLGTGGEDMALPFAKRQRFAEKVIELNGDRLPLCMGASFFSLEEMELFVKFLNQYSVECVHIMPYQQLLSLDRIEFIYERLADLSANPVWLYTSGNYCRHIPPGFVEKLSAHPNITGVKYSTSNTVDMGAVASLSREDFTVLGAVASTMYSSFCLGVDGVTSSTAAALPEAFLSFYDCFQRGDHAGSLEEQRRFNAFMKQMPAGLKQDNFLKSAEEKAILSLRGICERYTCSYHRDASREEVDTIRSALEIYYPGVLGAA